MKRFKNKQLVVKSSTTPSKDIKHKKTKVTQKTKGKKKKKLSQKNKK